MRNTLRVLLLVGLVILQTANGQNAPAWKPSPNDTLTSYRVGDDLQVQFSLYAPAANSVLLSGSDIPGNGRGFSMMKRQDGVWQTTVGPIAAGAYRYCFNVDGLSVIDPRNPLTSQAFNNTWSLFYTGHADFSDTRDVPHGAVAEVTYYSKSLKQFRRLHVYTPPDYELGKGRYPVFYLLHGMFDCDDAWSTVGRAGFILDNLIAAKKARPMIVVMPAGHTGPIRFTTRSVDGKPSVDEFVVDFVNDLQPFAESHYRIITDKSHRAIAGLSMGGMQTLNIALPHLDQFAFIGVFSSGIFGITDPTNTVWETANKNCLTNEKNKKGLRLFWFATGKEDFLLETSRKTVELFKEYDFNVVYRETGGGHTWLNWRDYLCEFTPQLF
jgi:enterochelin esterase-like enzyme